MSDHPLPDAIAVEAVSTDEPAPDDFYRRVLEILDRAAVPHLVGGAYALAHYTGTPYVTKDFDLFLRRADLDDACAALNGAGYRASLVHAHFLGKVYGDGHFVDLIFGSGNGAVWVDDEWFAHAQEGTVFGRAVRFCGVEEIIWSKSFIMERERFDGADIAHLLLANDGRLDWDRLLRRFGPYWRVLLAHLVLVGFVYPGRRWIVPDAVLDELIGRLRSDPVTPEDADLCRGGLLSRRQYLLDLNELGMRDARLKPEGTMTRGEVDVWSDAGDAPD